MRPAMQLQVTLQLFSDTNHMDMLSSNLASSIIRSSNFQNHEAAALHSSTIKSYHLSKGTVHVAIASSLSSSPRPPVLAVLVVMNGEKGAGGYQGLGFNWGGGDEALRSWRRGGDDGSRNCLSAERRRPYCTQARWRRGLPRNWETSILNGCLLNSSAPRQQPQKSDTSLTCPRTCRRRGRPEEAWSRCTSVSAGQGWGTCAREKTSSFAEITAHTIVVQLRVILTISQKLAMRGERFLYF
jgi:hypothetical protein